MSVSPRTRFFNRVRAAQTEPVRWDIRGDRGVLTLTNASGYTPLDHAIELVANKRGASVEMVNLLLDEGADPNFRGIPNGPTALHHAVGATELSSDVQHRIVTLLLKHGADPSLTDYHGQTPAQMPGVDPEIQRLLANAGSLRQAFRARGGVPVSRDSPTTPPVVAVPAVGGATPLQRVVSGAAQAVEVVGAAMQAASAAGAGIMSGLGVAQPAAGLQPVAVPVPDAELLSHFDQKNGALAMGNDVHVTECTLQEAFRKCMTLDAAVGFTYAPTAALPGGRYRCYFKSSAKKNSDPLWQTYLQKPTAPTVVIAPLVQSASTVPAACPRGHKLVAFSAPHSGFNCDGCRQLQANGNQLHGCRACDYDLCQRCFDAAPAGAQVPAVPPAQPAAPAGGGQAETETSDYNSRRLERRIKNLQATLTMLNSLGQDTTLIKADIAVQVSAQTLFLRCVLSVMCVAGHAFCALTPHSGCNF
jgi:hypothetical protein